MNDLASTDMMKRSLILALAGLISLGAIQPMLAQPSNGVPPKPNVKVIPGDGMVTLYWDDIAETYRDSTFSPPRNNFEGYKVYRATLPDFSDALRVTDNAGNPLEYLPIAQFDRINDITGYHPAAREGLRYWLGDDSGIRRVFEDTGLVNGKIYYYAVVAYTHGDAVEEFFIPIQFDTNGNPIPPPFPNTYFTVRPKESPIDIQISSTGAITMGPNVISVTPQVYAPGYIEPTDPAISRISGSAGGTVSVEIIDPVELKPNTNYSITFRDTIIPAANASLPDEIRTRDVSVRNLTTGEYLFLNETRFATEQLLIKDGLLINIANLGDRVETNPDLSGWRNTGNRTNHTFGFNVARRNTKLADYRVEFGEGIVNRSDTITLQPGNVFLQAEDVNFRVVNTTTGLEIPFAFFTNPGIPRDLQGSFIDPANPQIGYVVGGSGIIRKTTNGGTSWLPKESLINTRLNAVFFIDSQIGWAVGEAGAVLKTTDAGETWVTLVSGISRNLNDVWFLDANNGFAISSTISVSGQNQSIIYRTTDGGTTWSNLPIANSTTNPPGASVRNMNAMTFTDANNGYIVGANNELITTSDGGVTWNRRQAIPTPVRILNSIDFADANTGWIVGSLGQILKTTNAGLNWVQQTSGVTAALNHVSFPSLTHGWAVGANGTIIHTNDGGATWTPQTSGTTAQLFSVVFNDELNGYAFGNGPTILQTTDGGQQWSLITTEKQFRAYLQPANPAPLPFSDEIYFIEEYNGVEYQVTWKVDMLPPLRGGTSNPEAGDVLELVTRKPFTSADRYDFTIGDVNLPKVEESLAESTLDAIRVVPNPYVVSSVFETVQGDLANQRQLHFTRLPQECTIRIFSVSGQLVQTLQVSNSFNTSRYIWDMRDKNGHEIPYGVYVYHVEAPGVGEKIGKFAVIK
jgi:photosystem II stability/assembly factor-like uncharacterized protein